jgi:hypothetical protein
MNVVNSKKFSPRKLKTIVTLDKEANVDYEHITEQLAEELIELSKDKVALKNFIKSFVDEGYEEYKRTIKYGKI